MFALAQTFTIDGLEALPVRVEVDVRPGLPAFTLVGLGDAAVREARERIRTAILNRGLEFPPRRVTASLAPAGVPKSGAGLDLAIACAILAATGQVPAERLRGVGLLGELSLDGRVHGVPGTLSAALAARAGGLRMVAVAGSHAREAALVEGLVVAPVDDLDEAARVLRGGRPAALPAASAPPPAERTLDLAEVVGREEAVQALIVAAAGGHGLLLAGPPGTGKTMLARRLPTILPELRREEALEVTRIHGLVAGSAPALVRVPPFRSPHHTTTAPGLIGGGPGGRPGEAVMAHRGVLFLDELAEFARPALEALREPLEDGTVTVAGAGRSTVHPARFMLVAATNPCPCGRAWGPSPCRCSPGELARYARRLSGPLLDRIDLRVILRDRPAPAPAGTIGSKAARERVAAARERQAKRAEGATTLNSELRGATLARHARIDGRAAEILAGARRNGLLSARGAERVLRVARTLADLDERERVGRDDVGAALALRCEPWQRGHSA